MSSYDPKIALAVGNAKRVMNADLRGQVYRRELSLSDLFRDPPESIKGILVIDVCRWAMESRRTSVGLRRLNRDAIQADVNLAAPVGSLSPRQLGWLADRLGRVPLGRGPQRRKATA